MKNIYLFLSLNITGVFVINTCGNDEYLQLLRNTGCVDLQIYLILPVN